MRITRRGRRAARRTAGRLVPLLPSFVRLLGGLLRDRRVSLLDRGFLVAVILYVLSPLDLIPDVLGVLGLTDDLFLLALAVRRLVTGAGEDVVREHWSGGADGLRRLQEALADLGSLLPRPVRGILRSWARK